MVFVPQKKGVLKTGNNTEIDKKDSIPTLDDPSRRWGEISNVMLMQISCFSV